MKTKRQAENTWDHLPHKEKFEKLFGRFQQLGRALVAYSGGVDSTLLLKVGTLAIGGQCVGVTARSETLTDFEFQAAESIARDHGFTMRTIQYSELEIDQYADNPTNRCYFCKHELFVRLLDLARDYGGATVVEGSNADDNADWRPGLQAIDELEIVSPLREVELHKNEIRELARALGLPNWEKPSNPCLSSRIAYGVQIDRDKLEQVARGEQFLREAGFRQFRVRHHGEIARVEVAPDELDRLLAPDMRARLHDKLKEIGFQYVTVDLKGYRTGSMNEAFHTSSVEV